MDSDDLEGFVKQSQQAHHTPDTPWTRATRRAKLELGAEVADGMETHLGTCKELIVR